MAKYRIIRTTEPSRFKEPIINFWNAYLTNTPSQRFEWLIEGNPAGKTVWILAFIEETEELVGTVSLLPRDVIQNNHISHGAIMGDLMIHKKHRVFGPAISLLKNAIKYVAEDSVFDFIYTIPNPDSMKIVDRVGFKKSMTIETYAKPLQLSNYLKKFLPALISDKVSPLFELCLRIFSRETYLCSKGICEEISLLNEEFDEVWENITKNGTGIIREHSSDYIKWRYMHNPFLNFRMLAYREQKNKSLCGFLIFKKKENKITIYDICSLEKKPIEQMFKNLIRIARIEKCQAIYFAVPSNNKWPAMLKSYGFFSAKSTMKVYWIDNNKINLENWGFLEGDRNI